jgi:hypothetical protein
VEPPAPSQLVADCPAALDAIIAHALAKSPLDRYPDADDLAMDLHEVAEGITRAHISELMVEAEQHFNEREFNAARTALRQLLRLDSQNVAGKRLLSLVEQRLTQQERDRRVHELTRLAQQAAGERDWERALALCDEGLGLSPASATLIEVRKSVIEGKQTQERVSQLLQESANARKKGELSRAQSQAASAQRLDPLNTQIMALCKALGQEIDEKRRKEQLRVFLDEVKEQLAARDFEEALVWLKKAEAIYPEDAEVLRLKDQLAIGLTEDRRKAIVRKLEEKAAVSATVDKLRSVSEDLANALKEFPNDPALLRLRLSLEPRTQVMEDEFFIREVSKSSAELPPEEALARIREALRKVPGNEQLLNLESALSERVTRQTRERQLAQRLQEATQAIDNRLYLEAVKILERCQADGFSSYEIDGLLELAKSEASKRISQEVLEQTHSQAKRLIELEDYENAVQLLRGALRQVDEPVLHRQLEEALQKQQATEQRADAALERVDYLIRMELFDEAVLLLKEQSGGVKKLERVEQARVRASNMQEADANLSIVLGRCYAQMGNAQGIEDLKKALKTVATADAPGLEETVKRLRRRCEEIYGERASAAIASIRKFLAEQDRQGAEEVLRETTRWVELAPPQAQEELKLLQVQTAAAKRVLRFRRG